MGRKSIENGGFSSLDGRADMDQTFKQGATASDYEGLHVLDDVNGIFNPDDEEYEETVANVLGQPMVQQLSELPEKNIFRRKTKKKSNKITRLTRHLINRSLKVIASKL